MNPIAPVASPLGSSTIIKCLAVAVLCGLVLPASIGAQTDVITTDLGTLGGSYSFVSTLNAAGRVIGSSYTEGDAASHAVLWTLRHRGRGN